MSASLEVEVCSSEIPGSVDTLLTELSGCKTFSVPHIWYMDGILRFYKFFYFSKFF